MKLTSTLPSSARGPSFRGHECIICEEIVDVRYHGALPRGRPSPRSTVSSSRRAASRVHERHIPGTAVVLCLPVGPLVELYARIREGRLEWIAIGEHGWRTLA
jgi:hypothetical protein